MPESQSPKHPEGNPSKWSPDRVRKLAQLMNIAPSEEGDDQSTDDDATKRQYDDFRNKTKSVDVVDPGYSLVTDVTKGQDFADRHQILNIRERLLECALGSSIIKKSMMQTDFMDNGGFFQDYDDVFEKKRIAHPVQDPNGGGWLMIESRGKLTDRTGKISEEVVGGDIQMKIFHRNAPRLIAELMLNPRKGDRIESSARDIYKEILEHPSMVAWISDVCSMRDRFEAQFYPTFGFAKWASKGAFIEVGKINAERSVPVQWALSAIAHVKEIRGKSGKLLASLDWLNQRGYDLTRRPRTDHNGIPYRNVLLGEQVNRPMDVELPAGDPGQIIFHWRLAAQEIWRPGDEKYVIADQESSASPQSVQS